MSLDPCRYWFFFTNDSVPELGNVFEWLRGRISSIDSRMDIATRSIGAAHVDELVSLKGRNI